MEIPQQQKNIYMEDQTSPLRYGYGHDPQL